MTTEIPTPTETATPIPATPAPSVPAPAGASPSDAADLSKAEKIAASLTPLIGIGAGLLSAYAARHALNIPQGEIIWAFTLGVAAVVFVALKYLHSKDQRLAAIFASERALLDKLPGGEILDQLIESHLGQIRGELGTVEQSVASQIEAKLPGAAADAVQKAFSSVAAASSAEPKAAA